MRSRTAAALAALSGLVFATATPPLDLAAGILLGLVGFAVALRTGGGALAGAWRGFLFGLCANLLALRFVPDVLQRFTDLPAVAGWLALVLLSAAQALAWSIAGALASTERLRAAVPGWLAFGLCVYVATFLPAVFPWTPAGGLTPWPALVQTAELVGERGTSFLVAIACGLAAEGIVRALVPTDALGRARSGATPLGLAACLLALLTVFGALRMRGIDAARDAAPHATVALLDPDFDAMFRWHDSRGSAMLERLTALTKRAEENGAALTVWPESAYPYTLAHGTRRSPLGPRAVLQPGVHGPVLTGAYLTKGSGLGTNSAILVQAGGEIAPSYDKRHLLWFGETVPLADVFPVLRRIFARGTGLEPGSVSVAFRSGPIVAAVLNCYEDTLPAAGREALEVHPNLLVNITNDAWFVGTMEGELHLRIAVLRAIETRRDLVRSVNRGPVSWVDAAGRIRARRAASSGFGPAPALLANAALLDGPSTLYGRAGDVPLLAFLAALVFLRVRTHRTHKSATGTVP